MHNFLMHKKIMHIFALWEIQNYTKEVCKLLF